MDGTREVVGGEILAGTDDACFEAEAAVRPMATSFFAISRTESEEHAISKLRSQNPTFNRRCLTDEEIAKASLTSMCRQEFEDMHRSGLIMILLAQAGFVLWLEWEGLRILSFLFVLQISTLLMFLAFQEDFPVHEMAFIALPVDCTLVAIFVESPTTICVGMILGTQCILRLPMKSATASAFAAAVMVVLVRSLLESFSALDAAMLLLAAVVSTRGSRVITDLLLQLSTERIKLERQERIGGAILARMLPPQVTHKLKGGIKHIAYSHEAVTILFAEIQNVSQYVELPGEALVHQLNLVFSRFDALMQRHSVYKIETVGDVYVGCSGVPLANSRHAERCAGVALAMLEQIQHFTWPDGKQMEIKVGLHSGPIVSGVVGELLPRYRLFGDTINTASRMCSHNPSTSKVMCSASTQALLSGLGMFEMEDGGLMAVKGKGDLNVHYILSATGEIDGSKDDTGMDDLEGHAMDNEVGSLGYDVELHAGKSEGRVLAFAVGQLIVIYLPDKAAVDSEGGSASGEDGEGSEEQRRRSSVQEEEGGGSEERPRRMSLQQGVGQMLSTLMRGEGGVSADSLAQALGRLCLRIGDGKFAIPAQSITGITHTMERSTIRIAIQPRGAVRRPSLTLSRSHRISKSFMELTFEGSWLKHEFVTTLTEFTGQALVDDELFGQDTEHHHEGHVHDRPTAGCTITRLSRMADEALGLPLPRGQPSCGSNQHSASSGDLQASDPAHRLSSEGSFWTRLESAVASASRSVTTSPRESATSAKSERGLRGSLLRGSFSVDDAELATFADQAAASMLAAVEVPELHVDRTYSNGVFGAENGLVRLRSAASRGSLSVQGRAGSLEQAEGRRFLGSRVQRSLRSIGSGDSFTSRTSFNGTFGSVLSLCASDEPTSAPVQTLPFRIARQALRDQDPEGIVASFRSRRSRSQTDLESFKTSDELPGVSAPRRASHMDSFRSETRRIIQMGSFKVDSVRPPDADSPTNSNTLPSDEFSLDRIKSGEAYVEDDRNVKDAVEEDDAELQRLESLHLLANRVRDVSPTRSPRLSLNRSPNRTPNRTPQRSPSSSFHDVSTKTLQSAVESSLGEQPEARSVTSQDESWFDRLPAAGLMASGRSPAGPAGGWSASTKSVGQRVAEVLTTELRSPDNTAADNISPTLDHAPDAPWTTDSFSDAADGKRAAAAARAKMDVALEDEQDRVVGACARLLSTVSGMLVGGVGSLWPEVRPVQDVAPLTRKMLWKMTGGSDMTQSFVYRDDEKQAEMWERLLLSLRRHGKHGRWGEPFSDPLLRQTFAGQYAMRVRPTTSSNIVWLSGLLAARIAFDAAVQLCHASSESAQQAVPHAGESCLGDAAAAAAGAALQGAGASSARNAMLMLIPMLAAILAGFLAAKCTPRMLRPLDTRRLKPLVTLFTGAVHLHLVSRSGVEGGEMWPVLFAATVMVAAADLQRSTQTAAQLAIACTVWGLRSVLSGQYGEVLLIGTVGIALMLVGHHLDLMLIEHFRKVVLVEHEISMTLGICRNLLPAHVIDHMVWSNGKPLPCDRFEEVTILFADIVGFTSMSSKLTPQQLVDLLNQIFSIFDRKAVKNKVYKVETIGDCYFCATGMPEKDLHHADNMLRMALDMLETTEHLKTPAGDKIQFRIGVHSGGTVAGVMGDKMPRYHLFGPSVRAANELEQRGKPSKIHISDSTRQRLSPPMLALMQGDDPKVFYSKQASIIE